MPSQEQIDAYVSQTAKRYVSHAAANTLEEFQQPFGGAFVFADISGFSRLARRFANRGAEGAEELNGLINTYFDQLIQVLEDHGCDIVSFAGDAVLALLRSPATEVELEGLGSVARQAGRCGLAITSRLGDYQVADDVQLSIRVAIGVGQLATIALGQDTNRQIMLVGPPLRQVREADRYAKPGDVMISSAAMKLLGGAAKADQVSAAFRLREIEDVGPARGWLEPTEVPKSEKHRLRQFVSPAVLAQLTWGRPSGWPNCDVSLLYS